jgi:hypothetical protein
MELHVDCILCSDLAQERKYFFKEKPLCAMHYAEYLEVLIENLNIEFGGDDAASAFNAYRQTLEAMPLNEIERLEKVAKNKEKKAKSQSSGESDLYYYR